MSPQESPFLTIIANSIFPYGLDAVRVLSLPDNAVYRARFDQAFVSQQVQREYHDIKGYRGLYCFRDYESGTLLPLRWLQIDEISLIGTVYYIEYTVRQTLPFPQDKTAFDIQADIYNSSFREKHRGELKSDEPGRDLAPLVLLSTADPTFTSTVESIDKRFDQDTRHWAAVVRNLGAYTYFRYVPFVKVTGIRKIGAGSYTKLESGRAIGAGARYELQFVHNLQSDSAIAHSINSQRTDRDGSFIERASYRLTLSSDNPNISIFRNDLSLTGSYDVGHFTFIVPPSFSRQETEFAVHCRPEHAESSTPADYTFFFKLVISSNLGFPVIQSIFLAIFVFVYFVPNIFPFAIDHFSGSKELIRDLTVIAVAVTAFDLLSELRRFIQRRSS